MTEYYLAQVADTCRRHLDTLQAAFAYYAPDTPQAHWEFALRLPEPLPADRKPELQRLADLLDGDTLDVRTDLPGAKVYSIVSLTRVVKFVTDRLAADADALRKLTRGQHPFDNAGPYRFGVSYLYTVNAIATALRQRGELPPSILPDKATGAPSGPQGDYTKAQAWRNRPDVVRAVQTFTEALQAYKGKLDKGVHYAAFSKLHRDLLDPLPAPQLNNITAHIRGIESDRTGEGHRLAGELDGAHLPEHKRTQLSNLLLHLHTHVPAVPAVVPAVVPQHPAEPS